MAHAGPHAFNIKLDPDKWARVKTGDATPLAELLARRGIRRYRGIKMLDEPCVRLLFHTKHECGHAKVMLMEHAAA